MRLSKLLICVCIVAVFVYVGQCAFAAESVLKVIDITAGKVFIKTPPSEEWKEAAIGQLIHQGDYFKVDEGASLEFPDKSLLTFGPMSEMHIDELLITTSLKKLTLSTSSLLLKTTMPKTNTLLDLKLITPKSISQATGSAFSAKVTPTSINLYAGEQALLIAEPFTPTPGNRSIVPQRFTQENPVSGT